MQLSLNCPSLRAVKQKPPPAFEVLEGRCAGPEVCPLSRVKAGAVVCIKQLSTAPEVTDRLRELGFCEEQRIKLLTRQSNFICQVCNARLAISEKLADSIMVEAVPAAVPAGLTGADSETRKTMPPTLQPLTSVALRRDSHGRRDQTAPRKPPAVDGDGVAGRHAG